MPLKKENKLNQTIPGTVNLSYIYMCVCVCVRAHAYLIAHKVNFYFMFNNLNTLPLDFGFLSFKDADCPII